MCRSTLSSCIPQNELMKAENTSIALLFACLFSFSTASCERYAHFRPGKDGTLTPTDSTLSEVSLYTYEVVNVFPHDVNAYTQGLIYRDSVLYEGTGLYGGSTLRRVDLTTGRVLKSKSITSQFFGEGVAAFGDEIVQLTLFAQVGFVYDIETFQQKRAFVYPTDGWGLTHDGNRYIMSDGTATLYFRDLQTFEELGQVQVRDNDSPVWSLNELEFIEGEVFANVYQTDRIARINPATGRVVGWIDLSGLLPVGDRTGNPEDVLNGIAYDAGGERLFVTGKRWPKLYEIRLLKFD